MTRRRRRSGASSIGTLVFLAVVGLTAGGVTAWALQLPERLADAGLWPFVYEVRVADPATAGVGRGAAERILPTTNAAPPGCCTLVRTVVERGAEGCQWQVAEWRDAPPTRVPWGCPPGARPTRGSREITLVESWTQHGAEGCRWYAATWSDGITTRVPATCPPGAVAIRQALPHPLCYTPRQPTLVATRSRPASAGSLFQNCQVVSFYGYPGGEALGVLGSGTPEQVAVRLREQAAAYDAANGDRGVVPAFHVIYAVAQAYPTPDGTYLARLPAPALQRLLDAAEKYDFLVFLDVQIGWSSVAAEVERITPYLRNPRVHLALDPEFAMPPGVAPGKEIGSLDAAQINEAQEILQQLVEADGLPNKILIVHQFQASMITNKDRIKQYGNVDVVIDMDGFGLAAAKASKYEQFIKNENAEFGGIKLFYRQDRDLMPPELVLRLTPQPDVIIYQ